MWGGDIFETDGYLLLPNPAKTNVFVGKVTSVYFDIVRDVQMAIDRELTTKDIQTAMTSGEGLKGRIFSFVQNRMQQKMIDQIILWLERHDKAGGKISLVGAPYLLYFVMQKLQADGKSFDLGEDSLVVTGGGWKVRENVRMPVKDFRKQVHDVLGIPESSCLDLYGMVEGNEFMLQCPEGHYLHVPHTVCKPIGTQRRSSTSAGGRIGAFCLPRRARGKLPRLHHHRRSGADVRALPRVRSIRPGPRAGDSPC